MLLHQAQPWLTELEGQRDFTGVTMWVGRGWDTKTRLEAGVGVGVGTTSDTKCILDVLRISCSY